MTADEMQLRPPEWSPRAQSQRRHGLARGAVVALAVLALFFAWATLFPLATAVVTPGRLVASAKSTPVQHPIGGVVRRIAVANGDVVAKGDVLIELEPADKPTELAQLETRRATLTAQLARAGGNTSLGLRGALPPPAFVNIDDQALIRVTEIRDAGARIADLIEKGAALEERVINAEMLLAEAGREISRLQPLARNGPADAERVRAAERERLARLSSLVELEAQLSSNRRAVRDAEATPVRSRRDEWETSQTEPTVLLAALSRVEGEILATQTGTDATTLRAPEAGMVSGLIFSTSGGAIAPGAVVAEIVPVGIAPEVQFDVPHTQIDAVLPGGEVRVSVAAFHPRKTAPLTARILWVAADVSVNERTGIAAYGACAVLDGDISEDLLAKLRAGMPVEVVATGEPRTFFDYVKSRFFKIPAEASG